MSIQLLKQADMVLSPCGRPLPPPGYRWVDLPYCLTWVYQQPQVLAADTQTSASRIENKTRVPFFCRGVSIRGAGMGAANVAFRIWWPNGRNLEQQVSGANFAQSGAGSRTLMPEERIDPTGKITIEVQQPAVAAGVFQELNGAGHGAQWTNITQNTIQISFIETAATFIAAPTAIAVNMVPVFVPGVGTVVGTITVTIGNDGAGNALNWSEVLTVWNATPAAVALATMALVGIDSAASAVAPGFTQILSSVNQVPIYMYFWGVLRYLLKGDGTEPAPYRPDVSRAPRIGPGSNQNLMAPEWRLGNQCLPETPAGYVDEPFTLYSNPIANPVGETTVGVPVEVPNDCESFILRNIQYDSVNDDTVTSGVAALQIRLPSGYSLTNGDYLPSDWNGPAFPPLQVSGGGRIILDVADLGATGTGNITTTVQFDGVKRIRLQ
jgi:hypothetical protein